MGKPGNFPGIGLRLRIVGFAFGGVDGGEHPPAAISSAGKWDFSGATGGAHGYEGVCHCGEYRYFLSDLLRAT